MRVYRQCVCLWCAADFHLAAAYAQSAYSGADMELCRPTRYGAFAINSWGGLGHAGHRRLRHGPGTVPWLAREFGISRSTVRRWLRRAGFVFFRRRRIWVPEVN